MNFEEVITCLQNTDKREEFIARLKNAGKQSKPFLNLQSAMTELKMNKTPRGIEQKTIIQHTLRFSHVDECFQKFRLVCKSWKDAVETIRFNRVVGDDFFYNLDQKIDEGILLNTNYLSKYLKSFRKCMPLDLENKNKIFSVVLNNMKKLNEIIFSREGVILGEEYDSFAFQFLQNSHETLRVVWLPKLVVIPDISFPQLTQLYLSIGEDEILLEEFQTYFPQALKNMENLEIIELCLGTCWQDVGEYICENYSKQCVSASDTETLSVMPVKILEQTHNVSSFENKKYLSHLQYAHVYIFTPEQPMINGWDRYRGIFDQCINLKAIELDGLACYFLTETLPNMSEVNQEIWTERLSYFLARGIRLAHQNEIQSNENLKTKLAKEAGATWRFNFF